MEGENLQQKKKKNISCSQALSISCDMTWSPQETYHVHIFSPCKDVHGQPTPPTLRASGPLATESLGRKIRRRRQEGVGSSSGRTHVPNVLVRGVGGGVVLRGRRVVLGVVPRKVYVGETLRCGRWWLDGVMWTEEDSVSDPDCKKL